MFYLLETLDIVLKGFHVVVNSMIKVQIPDQLTLICVRRFSILDSVVVRGRGSRPLHLVLNGRQNGLRLTTARLLPGAGLITTPLLKWSFVDHLCTNNNINTRTGVKFIPEVS